jgi:hypothetical protein
LPKEAPPANARPANAERFGDGLFFKHPSTSVRDTDMLHCDRHAGARHHRLGHNGYEVGTYEPAERLVGETVRKEQVLGETARVTGKLFESPALFAT